MQPLSDYLCDQLAASAKGILTKGPRIGINEVVELAQQDGYSINQIDCLMSAVFASRRIAMVTQLWKKRDPDKGREYYVYSITGEESLRAFMADVELPAY